MIEFFFDCSSPWTYLAFHNIQPLAAEFGVPIRWRPVLVGGIFNAVNPSVYAMRENPVPPKRDYMLKDLQDWAREADLRIVFPPRVFPVNSVKDLVEYAKKNPGKLNYATSGVGTVVHLTTEYFASMAGVKLTHVPYKGVGQSIPDLMSGQISILFDNIMTAQPHIRSGSVRALAISSPKRSPLVPEVPTVAESGLPGFESVTWFGIFGPANTPRPVVERMNAEVNKALQDADVLARFAQLGFDPAGGSPVEFASVVTRDADKWSRVIRDANVKAE